MKQPFEKDRYRPGSLRDTRSARTVLLRMAADQERADRIRALKLDRPDLTWRRIADHVGVSERAASDWQKKGGIEYANAEKLAALFEVDVDYIWRGTETNTPDLSRNHAGETQLDRIEAKLDRLLNLFPAIELPEDDSDDLEHLPALVGDEPETPSEQQTPRILGRTGSVRESRQRNS